MGHGWHCQRRRAEAGLGPRGGCLGPWWGTINGQDWHGLAVSGRGAWEFWDLLWGHVARP